MRQSFAILQLSMVCALAIQGIAAGQTKSDMQKDRERFHDAINENQTAKLKALGAPEIKDLIATAELSINRIFTPENNELRKLARDFDQKLIPLQTSDFGRWVGTQPDSVATFIKLDTELIDLNDEALNLRRERLKASIVALRKYRPETQGEFDSDTNVAAQAIMKDTNWIKEQHQKLTNRLALIGDLETRFPSGADWSKFPTLRERKLEEVAGIFERIKAAEHEARKRASEQSADEIEKSVFDREVLKTQTQIEGEEALAKFARDLKEAEFGRQGTEIEKRIMATKLEIEVVKSEIVKMKADTTKDLLVVYLESDRVRSILQPFCSNGFEEAHPGAGYRRIDSLTSGPMSYSKISAYGCLPENHKGMRNLIRIANNSRNDRPGWGVDEKSYAQAGENHENIDGEMVNCYIEAQRILRVHGPTLVELKMLRK